MDSVYLLNYKTGKGRKSLQAFSNYDKAVDALMVELVHDHPFSTVSWPQFEEVTSLRSNRKYKEFWKAVHSRATALGCSWSINSIIVDEFPRSL